MTRLSLLLACTVLAAGCTAPAIDREFGEASRYSWERQIAFPDARYADRTPEGLEGIAAEEIMGVYNQTFAEAPEKVEIFELGLTGRDNE